MPARASPSEGSLSASLGSSAEALQERRGRGTIVTWVEAATSGRDNDMCPCPRLLFSHSELLLALISSELLPNPFLWGGARLTLYLLPVPPLLGVAGAVMAYRDHRLSDQGRVLWSVASGFGGLLEVFLSFVLITLIAGP